MYKGRLILPVLMMMVFFSPQAQAENTLKLEQAYMLVLSQNPQVRSYKARFMAAEGNRWQQSLRPNPEAFFEVEDFAVKGTRDGFEATQYTLGIEQQVEIAGKRSKREKLADLDKERARQEALAAIQAILAQTEAAYMRVAIAQERSNLAEKRIALTKETLEIVKKRVSAAKSADIQHTKTEIEVAAADVERRKAEKDLLIAKMTLANLMNVPVLEQSITADLSMLPEVPERAVIMQALEKTPMSIMSRLSVIRQEAAIDLARANGVPDPTFGLGVRRFAQDDTTALLAIISIPIPVSNRNQGRIAEAKANLVAAQSDQEVQRLGLTKLAMEIWHRLVNAREEALEYQNNILPSAQQAYAQAEYGFNRGAFSFLDLLDSQRTLFNVQDKYLKSLDDFHEAKAQVDLLTSVYAPAAVSVFDHKTNEKGQNKK
jgi:cobalt-zinc-cadmium efflux system outer membrane protein